MEAGVSPSSIAPATCIYSSEFWVLTLYARTCYTSFRYEIYICKSTASAFSDCVCARKYPAMPSGNCVSLNSMLDVRRAITIPLAGDALRSRANVISKYIAFYWNARLGCNIKTHYPTFHINNISHILYFIVYARAEYIPSCGCNKHPWCTNVVCGGIARKPEQQQH